MNGILYGVGVGPGDPELMTLKAVRLIHENEIIAVPGADPKETVAYQIAVQAVPELAEKTLLPVYMPMTHDREEMRRPASGRAFKPGQKRGFPYPGRSLRILYLYLSSETCHKRRIPDRACQRHHFLLRGGGQTEPASFRVE